MADLDALFEAIDSLTPDERKRLADYLHEQEQGNRRPEQNQRIFGMHRGAMVMRDDFDDELPDSFWLGEA
jgi:hypothetical protein